MTDFNEIRRNMKKKFGNMMINRCTGQSTKIALRVIAEAYAFPGTKVYIIDHHGTPKADECLADSIFEYINRLGFSGFKISRLPGKISIVYSVVDWAEL